MKRKFINTLSNRIIKELGSEEFGNYIKENVFNLPRTKNYLEQLSDEIYIDYQKTFNFDESFNKSIRNSDFGSILFQELGLGECTISPVYDINVNGGLTETNAFNYSEYRKILNKSEIKQIDQLEIDSNAFDKTMRGMFQGKFNQVQIKLCSDDVRNLIEEFTLSRNVDVIEILPAERDYHGCTHILPTENHVYKISGKKVKKIDIFEALETGLLDYESNDYQFDSVTSLKMNNKLVVEVNCLLVNKETEKNAKIEYNIRTDKLSFDATLNRLNLSSDDMLTMQKEVIESINEAIDSKFTLKAGDKYKIGFSSIRVPYYENSRDVGSFFVYDPDHLKIQEICKNLNSESEIYESNQIHPMYFEKALKAFDFDTLKIDKQLAVKNKNGDVTVYALNRSNREILEKEDISKELKETVINNWNVDLRTNREKNKNKRKNK